ncbi:MAG: GGDEF domain-containing protein, partial [Roseburia sp.]|nr:GGDEF domain-containing protein [Roseburia sp.]
MNCFFTDDKKRLVDDYLEQNEPGTHVLFVINIDHFHTITERFGSTVGETIIADMSRKIRESFRNTDIVGRIGGDEFVVFMKATTESFARTKAEQLCEKARKVIYGEAERMQVTVSVGGAIFGADGDSYTELFDNADVAMCAVKAEGGDGFLFGRLGQGENRKQERTKVENGDTKGENVDREL